jgi:hypothetical protein
MLNRQGGDLHKADRLFCYVFNSGDLGVKDDQSMQFPNGSRLGKPAASSGTELPTMTLTPGRFGSGKLDRRPFRIKPSSEVCSSTTRALRRLRSRRGPQY